MSESIAITQFERRLVEMGCPTRRLKEYVRELAEHFDDLKQAALEEGLTEQEAEARAATQLGDPTVLAENAVVILRQSSWWGRHPIVGFCVLPLLVFQFAWTFCVVFVFGMGWLLGKVFGPAYALSGDNLNTWSNHLEDFSSFTESFNSALRISAILLVTVIFCRLARRAAAGLRWMLAGCLSCATLNLFSNYDLKPCNITAGLAWPGQHWFFASVPLLAAGVLVVERWIRQRRFAGIAIKRRRPSLRVVGKKSLFYKTPTFWISTVLGLALVALVAKLGVYAFAQIDRQRQERSRAWPAERATTMAWLKKWQVVKPSSREQAISLKPYLNGTLMEAIDPGSSFTNNNLAALPLGVYSFGGVPFDIEGKIELGDGTRDNKREQYPTRVNIPVSSKCSKFYLLHGAANVDKADNRIAWLTLHYQDGSKAEIDITGGKDVLDWWGPIYNSDAGTDRNPTSSDTLLAWVGSNPAIRDDSPELSLRLYRTTFANPHPDLEISSIDYVSSLSGASPFLVGFTLEKP